MINNFQQLVNTQDRITKAKIRTWKVELSGRNKHRKKQTTTNPPEFMATNIKLIQFKETEPVSANLCPGNTRPVQLYRKPSANISEGSLSHLLWRLA